jgi:hypothetical protein
MAAVTCRMGDIGPLERLMRAPALDPTQRMIIVLLNERTARRGAQHVCGGAFCFPERRKGSKHVKFTRLDKQMQSEPVCGNMARTKPFVSTVFEGLLPARTSRQTRGTVYLYHVLGETQLPVSIFTHTPHGTSGAVELSRSHVMACVV